NILRSFLDPKRYLQLAGLIHQFRRYRSLAETLALVVALNVLLAFAHQLLTELSMGKPQKAVGFADCDQLLQIVLIHFLVAVKRDSSDLASPAFCDLIDDVSG